MWHIDDLKVLHVKANVIEEKLNKLDDESGKVSTITTTRGKIHDYLGMTIDYLYQGNKSFICFIT